MKSFLAKIFFKGSLLMLPFFAYYVVYYEYLIITRQFSNDGKTAYDAILKSKKKTSKKKVIFGDSVGFQLYKNWGDGNKDYYTMTTSAAGSVYGIYVLLGNFITENGGEGDKFYFIAHPQTFYLSPKSKYFYNLFIKPFYTLPNRKYFTPAFNDTVQCIPYWYAAQLPFIKISDIQPNIDIPYYKSPQPIAFDYLKMIDSLSKKDNFKFRVIPPVYINEIFKDTDYTNLKTMVHQYGLEEMFAGYFDSIKYLPNSEFKDIIHFKAPEKFGDNPMKL